jgi:hypothetical protein
MRIRYYLLLLLFSSQLTSCGKNESGSSSHPNVTIQKQESNPQGVYRVVLSSINPLAETATGAGTIKLDEETIEINLKMIKLPKRTKLYQFINTAGECPKMQHDLNKDGYIDLQESMKVAGEILIPLDGELSSQIDGIEEMPASNGQGFYDYREKANLESFMSDLKEPKHSIETYIMKLSSEQNLNLSEKSLFVLGAPPLKSLPETVQGRHGFSPQAGLPIACGKIIKIQAEE